MEAARAGEAGRGFAVVAEEVRDLAQRAATAARETTEKIESAVDKSAHGVDVCQAMGRSLAEIVENARKGGTLIEEIATASREQSQAIGQINTAVSQIDSVTQAKAAGSEEAASAAAELKAQADAMKAGVNELLALAGVGLREEANLRWRDPLPAAVQGPALDGLQKVGGADAVRSRRVGDRSRDLEDAIVGAARE